MRVRTFFRNYMLIPVVLIPVFTFALFVLMWRGGLCMSIEKGLLPFLFLIPVAVSFIVVAIVLIVRLCRKLPVLLLSQVLVIEVLVVVAFLVLDYKKTTWMLNQYLYQDKRVEFVKRIQGNPSAGEEQEVMTFIDTSRNYPKRITLHDGEKYLQNERMWNDSLKSTHSSVSVQRDCDGNLTVKFPYDGEFFGANYVVLYSDRKPVHSMITYWDANQVPHMEERVTVADFEMLDSLAPNWYYVRDPGPPLFNFDFDFGWGGGGSGGGGGSSGGCN